MHLPETKYIHNTPDNIRYNSMSTKYLALIDGKYMALHNYNKS